MRGGCFVITRIIKYVTTIIVIIVVLFLLRVLENNISEQGVVEVVNTMKKDYYNGYGLEGDMQLSNEVIFEDEEVVCYSDRLLKKFSYDEKNTIHLSHALEGLLETCQEEKLVMVMPVPPRIITEDGWSEQQDAYHKYIKNMESSLPGNVKLIDISTKLQDHKEEYIFFRTEASWTARGAYYAMEVLGDEMGIDTLKLEDYEEYMYKTFLGTQSLLTAEVYKDNPEYFSCIQNFVYDPTFYYQLPAGKNLVEIIRNDEGIDYHTKQRMISVTKGGINTFVGGEWDRAIVEGDGRDVAVGEQGIILVCDDRCTMIAPFIANYYKQVYLIDVVEYEDFSIKVNNIMNKYNVCNIILVQDCQTLGDISYSGALNGFANKQ